MKTLDELIAELNEIRDAHGGNLTVEVADQEMAGCTVDIDAIVVHRDAVVLH